LVFCGVFSKFHFDIRFLPLSISPPFFCLTQGRPPHRSFFREWLGSRRVTLWFFLRSIPLESLFPITVFLPRTASVFFLLTLPFAEEGNWLPPSFSLPLVPGPLFFGHSIQPCRSRLRPMEMGPDFPIFFSPEVPVSALHTIEKKRGFC